MIAVLFFIPTVQMVMFGIALTSETKNINMAISGGHSAIARQVQAKAMESGWFGNVFETAAHNPADLLIDGETECVLVFPPEGAAATFEKGGTAQLLINAINAQRAQQVNAYVSQLLSRVAEELSGQSGQSSPLRIEMRIMYNHYMDTKNFMVPALAVMASFIVILLVCAMSITKEKETGTMEKLISSPISTQEILAGKIIPYFIIGIAIMGIMLAIGILGFGLPLRGKMWQLVLNAVVLDACALAIATLISTVAKSQQQAMMGCILVLLPFILLSGILFPVSNIPPAFRWICYLDPMMYGAANFRNAMLKGGDPQLFWLNSGITAAMAAALFAAAWKRFKNKIN